MPLFLIPIFSYAAGEYDPVAVYLTWQHDPTTTMTVQWITDMSKDNEELYYKREGEDSWKMVIGTKMPMPEKEPYFIHKTELVDLAPGASYTFKAGEWNAITYKFRTLPKTLEKPLRFVVGGDMYQSSINYLIPTNKQAAKVDPMFALVGGDIAYGGSKKAGVSDPDKRKRWLQWLVAWKRYMVTPEGYLIPIVPAIGNHDVNGGYGQTPDPSSFFYSLFSFPGIEGYNVLDIGDYLSLIILDSGHTNPIQGKQTLWLYQTLEKRKNISSIFALYHVPAYPCVRKYDAALSNEIRKFWVPIFERFGVTAAFENHDHAYKRTPLIFKGRVDPGGVLYMGDGGWGVKSPRKVKNPKSVWYLAKTAQARTFILVTLDRNTRDYKAFDDQGKMIDSYSQVINK